MLRETVEIQRSPRSRFGLFLYLLLLVFSSYTLHADQHHKPGEVRLTPKIDLFLEPTPIEGLPGHTLNLPPGFKVKLFSDLVNKVRFMAWDDQGVLHAANMKTRRSSQWTPASGRRSLVLAFPDADNDGRADRAYIAADDFHWPHSIAFFKEALFVADDDAIYRLEDRDGDGFYEQRTVFAEVPGFMGRSSEHVTHSLLFDEQNDKLYFHVGSGCDLCRENDPERATILQFNTDGSGRRIFASGLRNAIGLDLHPLTGELWAAGNGHDREGRSLPPEWITPIREGRFYGWPLAYGFQTWTDFSIPEYQEAILPLTRDDSLVVASIERPAAMVPAHLAPMGLHFYTHNQFPSQYHNAAFVAFRAGVLGNDPGYKVMVLFADPDGSNAQIADFLTGFRSDPDSDSFWGTPVGLTSDEQGFLYLSSDRFTQAIFRIEASPLQGLWQNPPPDSLLTESPLYIDSIVRVQRKLKDLAPLEITADLSSLGGPVSLPLQKMDDETYRLQVELSAGPRNGRKNLVVHLEQGNESTKLIHSLIVLPREDQELYSESFTWDQGAHISAELDPAQTDTVFAGERAIRVVASRAIFAIDLKPPEPVSRTGYTALRLAFHPGHVTGGTRPSFSLSVNGDTDNRLHLIDLIDLQADQWQSLEVDLDHLASGDSIESLRLIGNLRGTFYLDEIRLIAARATAHPTSVRSESTRARPEELALQPNYPNPFNQSTVIRYRLSQVGRVQLEVYDLQGQRVRTLADRNGKAGTYHIEWNGTDTKGAQVATGVYFIRLQTQNTVRVHKMLLLK